MSKYKKILNDYQLSVLNLIDNERIRKNLMSILSYMTLVNEHKNKEYNDNQLYFLEKEPDELTISFEKLHKLYLLKHKKISLQTLKNRIEKLVELKLLVIVSRLKKTNVYQFALSKVQDLSENISDNLSDFKPTEPTENQSSHLDNPPIIMDYGIKTKDLDSNTQTVSNYESYIDNEEKVCSLEVALNKLEKLFKVAKVKSSYVKQQVRDKLEKYYTTIAAKHLDAYIAKMIFNAREQSRNNFGKYVLSSKGTSAPGTKFNNFECRNYSDSEYKFIENRLLGWD